MVDVHCRKGGQDARQHKPDFSISLDVAERMLGLRREYWKGVEPPALPRDRFTDYKGPEYVLALISGDEARARSWRTGWYFAPISVAEVRKKQRQFRAAAA